MEVLYRMKKQFKHYLYIALTFLLLAAVLTQGSEAIAATSVLKQGMSGKEVLTLQQNLKKLGYFKQTPTQYFGDATKAAVIQFQKEHGITTTGQVAALTSAKINQLISKPVLKYGMKSSDVTTLQIDLKKLKFFTQAATGYFGSATQTAVQNLQKQYHLGVTGIADTLTHVKIDSLLCKTAGIKIVLDPGHGGIDRGTSIGKVYESEIVLAMAKRLKSYLAADGYDIVMTRNSSTSLDRLSNRSGTRQQKDLDARTSIINKSGASLFVSLHINSCPEAPSCSGSIVFYNSSMPGSKLLAQNIQKALNQVSVSGFSRQTHTCREENYYVLRNSNIRGVLVETAYITNAKELKLLPTASFQDKIVRAVRAGILNTDL